MPDIGTLLKYDYHNFSFTTLRIMCCTLCRTDIADLGELRIESLLIIQGKYNILYNSIIDLSLE